MALLALVTACKFGEEKQSVSIDTPQEVKAKEKKVNDLADQSFIDGMTGKLFHNYLEIKMALGYADSTQVQQTAKSMYDSFGDKNPKVKELTKQLANAETLEKQRVAFSELTAAIGPMFEDALSAGTIYLKHCPMAFNNEGADWYADVTDDINPYFGDEMPKCGKVVKTIAKEK